MSDFVSYELIDKVAVLRMDDGKANALSYAMLEGLGEALDRAQADKARALVLAGRAGKFSAGFDLKEMTASLESAIRLLDVGTKLMVRLYTLPMPVLIAASGHAVAGGAMLLLCGDVRVGIEGPFRIGFNETTIGMRIPVLGIELARDRLVPGALADALMGARMYEPAEALQASYLDAVVAPQALEATVLERAAALARLDTRSYGGTKRALREATAKHILESFEQDMDELRQGR